MAVSRFPHGSGIGTHTVSPITHGEVSGHAKTAMIEELQPYIDAHTVKVGYVTIFYDMMNV